MDEYSYYQPRRRRKGGTYGKVIVILVFAIAGMLAAGKLMDMRANVSIPTLPEIKSVISTLTEDSPAQTVLISADITAANACVINANTNAIIYQKNSADSIAPASTAKMLTALTALDYYSPSEELRVSAELDFVASDASTAWLYQGDILTVKQLLTALMLPSGNDAAYTLAVNTGKMITGDDNLTAQQYIDTFVAAMNKKAKELGATSSNFVTPDGYDVVGQHTTAYDLAQIARACLGNDCLAEIMGSFTVYDTWPNGREVTYYNTNELLNPGSDFYYPDAIGLKTGNSSEAGACLISAAVINGETYICVVMGSTEDGRFQDSIAIYNELKDS